MKVRVSHDAGEETDLYMVKSKSLALTLARAGLIVASYGQKRVGGVSLRTEYTKKGKPRYVFSVMIHTT